MDNLELYQILPCQPNEQGFQKCFIDNNLFEALGATIGQCACLCVSNKIHLCKLWPRYKNENYIHLDKCVYSFLQPEENTCYLKHLKEVTDTKLQFIKKQCILLCDNVEIKHLTATVITEDYKSVGLYNDNLLKLNNAIKDILLLCVINSSCIIETYKHPIGKVYGFTYIIINDIQPGGNLVCGNVTKETLISVSKVESKDRYKQRDKYKDIKIGGLEHAKQTLKELIELPLYKKEALKSIGVSFCNNVLLRGPSGCGKSSLVKVISYECEAYLLSVIGPELTGSRPGETEQKLKEIFHKAEVLCQEGPCILFFDEIDFFGGKKAKGTSDQERRSLAQLVQLLDMVNEKQYSNLVIVAASNRPEDLDPVLRRPGRLEKEVFIGIPNQEERLLILDALKGGILMDPEVDMCWLAEATPGYVGADLMLLLQQAYYGALDRSSNDPLGKVMIGQSDIVKALHNTRPSTQKGSDVFVDHSPVKWDQIGGLQNVKEQIKQAIELPIKHPEAFKRLGLPAPKGVLLYGPPGCAKTTLVRAAATSCHVTFLSVSCAQLYSPFVGDSEKKIAEIFKQARAGSPCILFFDEIDSLVGSRSKKSNQSSVQERVLSTLLNEMDGVGMKVDTLQSSSKETQKIPENSTSECYSSNEKTEVNPVTVNNSSVMVVAATNRPDMLDDAILRPGRIDKIIYVPPPDVQARLEILKVHTSSMALEDNTDLNYLAERTEYFTGADLENLCREAALHALSVEGLDVEKISQEHFNSVLKKLQPSLSKEELQQYQHVKLR